jgi:hypothetical protein
MTPAATFPTEIRSGDTVHWRHASDDYSSGDGWDLVINLVTAAATVPVAGVPQADGSWLCTLAAAANTLAAGHATWAAVITRPDERHTVETGTFVVLPDLTAAGGRDTRSHVRRVLDNVQLAIEGKASQVEAELTVGDKAVKYMSHKELLDLRREYSALWAAEVDRERVRRGGRSRNKVRVQF